MHKLGTFLRDARAGATAIAAATVAVMVLAGTALVTDHLWLVDQRDTLKSASDAATVAAVHEMSRLPSTLSDAKLKDALSAVATRYIEINLQYLPQERLERAMETLEVTVAVDRDAGTVEVGAEADLGGTLLARHLPLLGGYAGPGSTNVKAGVESVYLPVEVVLAIDYTSSMSDGLDGNPVSAGEDSRMDVVKQAALELLDTLDPDGRKRVAVGVVPWEYHVRLDQSTRERWEREGWVANPAEQYYHRPYTPKDVFRGVDVEAVTQSIPPTDPGERWRGCLQPRSLDGDDPPGLGTALPSSVPVLRELFFSTKGGQAYRCLDEPFPANYRNQSCFDPDSISDPYVGTTTVLVRKGGIHVYEEVHEGSQFEITDMQPGCPEHTPVLHPLSTDRKALESTIEALEPLTGTSHTYSGIGVVWARRMLAPEWRTVWGHAVHPADPADPGFREVRKAIVLLTDGEDHLEDTLGVGVTRDAACTAAKNAGIEIYVVGAMDPTALGGTDSELARGLRKCSSESSNSGGQYTFLNHATNEDLLKAFREITRQLMFVRRTQ